VGLKGEKVVVQGPSGTGKTTMSSILTLQQVDPQLHECQAIILAPTRELAQKFCEETVNLSQSMGIAIHKFIEGISLSIQRTIIRDLRVQVAVGTTDRMLQLIRKHHIDINPTQILDTSNLKIIVIDSADLMFKDFFRIREFFEILPKGIQVILSSTTITPEVSFILKTFMVNHAKDPVEKREGTSPGTRKSI
jgi:superfamily II DNA/RNA helicase